MRNPLLILLFALFVGACLPVDSVAQAPQSRPQTTPPPLQVEHPPGPGVPEPKPSGWQAALRWLLLAPSAGIEAYREGRFSAAFAAFLRGYSHKEPAQDSGFNLALTAHRLGQFDKAEGLWRKFITSAPKDHQARVHYNLGNALVASGKLDGALAAFQRALELDPKLGQAARNLRYTQKLKAHLDRKAQQSKQRQNGQKNQQQQGKKQDQKGQKQNDQQQGQQQQRSQGDKNQRPDKDGKNEAQDPRDKDRAENSSKEQDKNSDSKDDKNKSRNDKGDNKDGPSTDKGRSQRKKAWQQQKSLNQRNSERLLESIEEDRKNYLKRRLRPSSRDQSGGKTW